MDRKQIQKIWNEAGRKVRKKQVPAYIANFVDYIMSIGVFGGNKRETKKGE